MEQSAAFLRLTFKVPQGALLHLHRANTHSTQAHPLHSNGFTTTALAGFPWSRPLLLRSHSLKPSAPSPHPSLHRPPAHYITLFGIIFAQRYELHFCIFKPPLIHSCFLALFAQVPAPPTGSEAPGNMPALGSACPTTINCSTPGPLEWTQGHIGCLFRGP